MFPKVHPTWSPPAQTSQPAVFGMTFGFRQPCVVPASAWAAESIFEARTRSGGERRDHGVRARHGLVAGQGIVASLVAAATHAVAVGDGAAASYGRRRSPTRSALWVPRGIAASHGAPVAFAAAAGHRNAADAANNGVAAGCWVASSHGTAVPHIGGRILCIVPRWAFFPSFFHL